ASGRDLPRSLVPRIEKRNRDGDDARPAPGQRARSRARPRDERTEVLRRFRVPSRRWLWLAGGLAIAGGGGLGLFAGHHARPTGQLLVVSDPADADIVLDGEPRAERTPAALRDLSPGEHRLRVHRAHH